MIFGFLSPGKLLPSAMETVDDSLTKHLLFDWWSCHVHLLSSPMEAVPVQQ